MNNNAPNDAPEQPLDLLRVDPDNARTISDVSLDGLGTSMHEFGDLSGIVWNEQLGVLVAGHQRVNRLRAAGATTWLRLSEERGVITHPETGEVFPVRIVRWDTLKSRAANLTANNPLIAGEFTKEALDQLKALEQDALFEGLRLNALMAKLEVEDLSGWNSDIDPNAKHGENTDGILAVIRVTCPQEARSLVTETIERALVEAGLTEAKIAT